MRIKMLPGVLVIAALVTLAISLGVATPNVYGGGDDTLPTLPEKAELKYPNLGSMLNQMAARVEAGEATAEDAAGDAPVHRAESVAVTIYLSGNVDGVVSFLEDNGGSPRNVGEDYIEAYVPVSLLGPVSEQTGGHPGAGNCAAGAGIRRLHQPGRPGPPFGGLEPGRVQRPGRQGGDNRRWL